MLALKAGCTHGDKAACERSALYSHLVDASKAMTSSVAGFQFGASIALIARTCTSAGGTWKSMGKDEYLCSAVPVASVPSARGVLVTFCGVAACEFTLVLPPDDVNVFADTDKLVTGKYGTPGGGDGETTFAGALAQCHRGVDGRARRIWTFMNPDRSELVGRIVLGVNCQGAVLIYQDKVGVTREFEAAKTLQKNY